MQSSIPVISDVRKNIANALKELRTMKWMLLPLFLLPSITSAGLVIADETVLPAVSAPRQIVQIQPLLIQKEVWKGDNGSSLRMSILKWAEKAHWNVVWDTKTDYPLLAPVQFEGRFEEAVSQFIQLYEAAEQPLVADIQIQQSLIYITNRKP